MTLSAKVKVRPHNSLDFSELDSSRKKLRENLILWMMVIGLAILILPLYLTTKILSDEIDELEGALSSYQETLGKTPIPSSEIEALKTEVIDLEQQIKDIELIIPTIVASQIDWRWVLVPINDYDPALISILSLEQQGKEIVITGLATDESVVQYYIQSLNSSQRYHDVILQTNRLVPPLTSVVAAGVTPSPGDDDATQPTPVIEFHRNNLFPSYHEFVVVVRMKPDGP